MSKIKTILLIDDDNTFTWCMKKYLFQRGYHAETASTVAEAKDILKQIIPLYICSDLDLPDGSGFELLDIVRVDYPNVPFLIVSCREREDYEQKAIKRGATLCIDKMKTDFVLDKLLEYSRLQ